MSSSRAHCGQSGHDSQACVEMGGGFKLFGVRFSMDSAPAMPSGAAEASSSSSSSSSSPNVMRKSFSMGNLRNCKSTERESLHPAPSVIEKPGPRDTVEGYASDDFVHSSSNPRERKKGIPWTKEEHVSFLLGLEKLGKSEWRGIARDFVKTRTPTQVASHAQKYFLRRNSTTKRRRRSSLFDIIPKMVSNDGEIVFEDEGNCEDTDVLPELTLGQSVPHGKNHIIDTLQFSPKSHPVCRFSDAASLAPLSSAAMIIPETNEISNGTQCDNLDVNQRIQITYCDNANLDPMNVDCMGPLRDTNCNRGSFCSPSSSFAPTEGFYCVPYSACWGQTSNIVKPMPRTLGSGDGSKATVHSKDPCINTMRHVMEPTPLSYKLMQEGSRQSAFHVLSQQHSKEIDGQGNTSNAISVL